MSRERDGGREPRKEPVDRLTPDRARDGEAEEPLRFGPEREPQGDAPKGRRPDWKKASTRKVRETTAPAEPERRGDSQPPPEQAAQVLQDDPVQPTPTPTPEPEQEESDAIPQEVEGPRGPDRPDPHGGPASRLRFDKESDTVKPEPDSAAAPKGSRPAGRGPSPSQEAGAGMGQSVPKDGTGGKFRKESTQDKVNRAKFRMEQREGTECAGVEPEPEPEPEPAEDPEPEPEAGGGSLGLLAMVLAAVVICGGVGWYFKIYRPKQERAAAQAEEDYGDEPEPYDDPEEDYDPYGEDEYGDDEETEGKS